MRRDPLNIIRRTSIHSSKTARNPSTPPTVKGCGNCEGRKREGEEEGAGLLVCICVFLVGIIGGIREMLELTEESGGLAEEAGKYV